MYTFRWTPCNIINTHTILLAKSTSSLSDLKSNIYKKSDKDKKKVTKTKEDDNDYDN